MSNGNNLNYVIYNIKCAVYTQKRALNAYLGDRSVCLVQLELGQIDNFYFTL